MLDQACELWSSLPADAARLARWCWQDARRLKLREVEAAADAFLASMGARPWF